VTARICDSASGPTWCASCDFLDARYAGIRKAVCRSDIFDQAAGFAVPPPHGKVRIPVAPENLDARPDT
jgi:hypothetical protein